MRKANPGGLLALTLLFVYCAILQTYIPNMKTISPAYYEAAPVRRPPIEPSLHLEQDFFSHRGDDADHIEHTFASYDAAIEKGSHYIEQDLEISRDGTLYVSHDSTAWRIFHWPLPFSWMSDSQINRLRCDNGEPPHTLQSVFDRYRKTVTYIVEVRPGMADAFIEIVKKKGMEHNIIVQSKSLNDINEYKKDFPEMPTLYLAMDLEDVAEGLLDQNTDIICVNKKWNTKQMAEWIHSYGKLFALWTLDTQEEINLAKQNGANVWFTDTTTLGEEENQ